MTAPIVTTIVGRKLIRVGAVSLGEAHPRIISKHHNVALQTDGRSSDCECYAFASYLTRPQLSLNVMRQPECVQPCPSNE